MYIGWANRQHPGAVPAAATAMPTGGPSRAHPGGGAACQAQPGGLPGPGTLHWTWCTTAFKDVTQHPATDSSGWHRGDNSGAFMLHRLKTDTDSGNHFRPHTTERASTAGCAVRHHLEGSRQRRPGTDISRSLPRP